MGTPTNEAVMIDSATGAVLNNGPIDFSTVEIIPSIVPGSNNSFNFVGDSNMAGNAVAPGEDMPTQFMLLPAFNSHGTKRNLAVGGTGILSTINAGTISATITSGSNIIEVASTSAVKMCFHITGSGIPANSYVTGITDATHFTIGNNASSSGTPTLTMTGETLPTSYPYTVSPHRPTANGGDGGVVSYLIIQVGANDCQIASNATDFLTPFEAYLNTARSDGFTLIFSPVLPHNGYSYPIENIRVEINNVERTLIQTEDTFFDIAGIFPDYRNLTYYQVDGIHLTPAALIIWARELQTSVLEKKGGPSNVQFNENPISRTTFSDTTYQSISTDSYIAQIGTLTSPRKVYLYISSFLTPGTPITIADESGTCNETNTITITCYQADAGGTDRLNDIVNGTFVLSNPYEKVTIINGLNSWQVDNNQASTTNIPIPSVTGGGTNPIYVFEWNKQCFLGIANVNSLFANYFHSEYLILAKNGSPTQSVVFAALPFAPQWFISWLDMFGGGDMNCPNSGIMQVQSGAANSAFQNKYPFGPNNGATSKRLVFTFNTANISASVGDTLKCCSSAGGIGGSQFTFTLDETVASSAIVAVRSITNGAAIPTTGDTHLYNITTATDTTTTYSKNTATDTSAWPDYGVWFPSTNGANTNLNFFTNTQFRPFSFAITAI